MKMTKNHLLVVLFITLCCMESSTKITTYKGVLDRMENDQAIILLESLNKTIVVPQHTLPTGSEPNMWFDIELIDDTYKVIAIDHKLTIDQERKSTRLLEKLRHIRGGLR